MFARKVSWLIVGVAVFAVIGLVMPDAYRCLRSSVRNIYFSHVLGTPLIKEVPRIPIDCNSLDDKGTMVALVLGQSNSANFGSRRNSAESSVYSFFKGRCYRAIDPMPGADGEGGSVWPIVGDELVRKKRYRSVVFITIGVAGSSIARWAPGGDLHKTIIDTWLEAKTAGLNVTHVLWHQGEKDMLLRTGSQVYVQKFKELVSSMKLDGILAPIYISIASYCDGKRSEAVTGAQLHLIENIENAFAGPNTDQFISQTDRYDECHLSPSGMSHVANAWVSVLSNN